MNTFFLFLILLLMLLMCEHACHVRVTYVLEASLEDLQLLAGEPSLGLHLLQSLGAMADGRQLQLILYAVWGGGGKQCTKREATRGGFTLTSSVGHLDRPDHLACVYILQNPTRGISY